VAPNAEDARNHSLCDSMLVGDQSAANTFPYMVVANDTAIVEHEATTSRISADQLFYLQARGIDSEAAVSLLVSGFCQEVFRTLPLEFAVEAVRLLEVKLEDSVG
jgi:Fe-S cluster assembly protein SufB